MKESQARHVCWMYIYTAYSIGSKARAHRKSIVAARHIWKQMNVTEKTIRVVSTTENYQCSQAVIGQLCIVSYRWLANSIMSTIIAVVSRTENYQCSQAVIGQLCIVSYRLLVNSIMSTVITRKAWMLSFSYPFTFIINLAWSYQTFA